MFDDVLGAAHDHGRDAVLFQSAGRQADALVANRAIGNEDRSVDRVFLATAHDLPTIDLERHPMTAVGRQAMKARSDSSDPAVGRLSTQLGEREIGADVLGTCMLAI